MSMSADTTHFRSVSLGPRGLTKRYTGLGYYLGCRMSYCIRTRGHLPSHRVALRAGSNRFFFFGTSVLDGRVACSDSGGVPTGLIAVDNEHTFRVVNLGEHNVGPSDLVRRARHSRPGGPISLLRRRDLAHFSHDQGNGDNDSNGNNRGDGGDHGGEGGGDKGNHPRKNRRRNTPRSGGRERRSERSQRPERGRSQRTPGRNRRRRNRHRRQGGGGHHPPHGGGPGPRNREPTRGSGPTRR